MAIKKKSLKKQFEVLTVGFCAVFIAAIISVCLFLILPSMVRVNRDTENMQNQVQKNIEYKLESAKKVAESIGYDETLSKFLKSENIDEKITFSTQMQGILNKMSITDKSLNGICIYYGDDQELNYSVETAPTVPFNDLPKERILGKKSDCGIFSAKSQVSYTYYSCAVYDIYVNTVVHVKRIGTVVVIFDSEEAFAENKLVCNYVITDDENNVVFSNSGDYAEGETIDDSIIKTSSVIGDTQNKIYFVGSRNYWVYFGVRMGFFIIIAMVISILLIAVNHVWLYRGFLRPVDTIVHEIREIKEADGSHLLSDSIAGNTELEEIVGAINFFIKENEKRNNDILEMKENIYHQQAMARAMEAEYLKQQIKPHFLYNTLGCVRSIAMHSGLNVISDSIASLISILRYGTSSAQVVNISEELDVVKRYIELLNLRFGNKFRLNIVMPPELEQIKIAKLLIQPIIENCINHAYRDYEGKSKIDMHFEREGEKINIIIRDYGCGIAPEKLKMIEDVFEERVPATDSVGMYNVNKRIKLIYGNDFGIFVSSKVGNGTCVEIKVREMGQNEL